MPEALWRRLAAMDPADVARRSGARVSSDGVYDVPVLNDIVRVDVSAHTCTARGPLRVEAIEGHLRLASVAYLISAQPIQPSGEWVSPRDFPAGSQFFRGPHDVPVRRIIERFGERPEDFRRACERWGGRPLAFADVSFAFRLFPRWPVAALLWAADEEFAARASMLVDRTADRHLPLDAFLAGFGLLEGALLRGE